MTSSRAATAFHKTLSYIKPNRLIFSVDGETNMRDHPPKTAMQMRLEAERRANPQPPKRAAGKINSANRPAQHSEAPAEVDATSDWLAHIAAGRIQVR